MSDRTDPGGGMTGADETQFEIVSDDERIAAQNTLRPHVRAVLEGRTIFLPGAGQGGIAGRFASITARGKRVHSRAVERGGVKGVLVWAEDRGAA